MLELMTQRVLQRFCFHYMCKAPDKPATMCGCEGTALQVGLKHPVTLHRVGRWGPTSYLLFQQQALWIQWCCKEYSAGVLEGKGILFPEFPAAGVQQPLRNQSSLSRIQPCSTMPSSGLPLLPCFPG